MKKYVFPRYIKKQNINQVETLEKYVYINHGLDANNHLVGSTANN